MRYLRLIFFAAAFISISTSFAQDEEETEINIQAFKSNKICLAQSIENVPNGDLHFLVSHHFGAVNQGFYEFFGLDQATTRIGFEYGVNDFFCLGIGRSTLNKTYDGYAKFRILRQKQGDRNMPLSLSYYVNMAINGLKWTDPDRTNYWTSRLSYTHQILIARKFGEVFSFQIMPTMIHRNLVEREIDENDVFSIGFGGTAQISELLAINAEYHYLLPGQTADDYYNSFTIGVDLFTGGHVFQLFATNSRGIIEQYFIPQTSGSWGNGDIHIGFNIIRSFTLKPQW